MVEGSQSVSPDNFQTVGLIKEQAVKSGLKGTLLSLHKPIILSSFIIRTKKEYNVIIVYV